MLDMPLTAVKGIGPKRAEQFCAVGVRSVRDLLCRLPRDYLDYSKATPVCSLKDGTCAAVQVRVGGAPRFYRAGGKTIVSASAQDETGTVSLKWFNQPYRSAQVKPGETVYACGRVSRAKGLTLINPTISAALPGILPVYATVRGLNQRAWRESEAAALESVWDGIGETLPQSLTERFGLVPFPLALRHAHFPYSNEAKGLARKRLDFENALLYLLAVELQRADRFRRNGFSFDCTGVPERFASKLPFSLTNAQRRAMKEISDDMQKPVPMNRLLQGDVGSGKTAVALYALCVAAANGRQGALLAPTEILAEQHMRQLRQIFGDAAVLLTGGMKKSARDAAKARIADGTALCVVGTHALLSEDVRFSDLGCVVTDEQHRFGVRQRAAMLGKGVRPDMLVMSATPIPRTLALLLYGDLDVSVLDELPPGRKPVKTSVIPAAKRNDMYAYIAREAKAGAQAYVVCPLIEESELIGAPSVESLCRELKKKMPGVRVAGLHGRMRAPEKEAVMRSFRDGETDVLVTTTVVEVGVHVPNARVMVIEGAERFGLSQLHQLRGRVGRSDRQAYCFLLSASEDETETARMRALAETNDGFAIAQKDLDLRGPGDFMGVRQHGENETAALSSLLDVRLLEEMHRVAREIAGTPNDENARLIAYAEERFSPEETQIAMN